MELHNLKPAKGSVKRNKRIARGQGSGHGGTSTRGHKGAKSRSGYKSKRNFEGGQMPLQMRIPKRGFKNPNRIEYRILNLNNLEDIASKYSTLDISIEFLKEKNYLRKGDVLKVLGNGEISSKLNVTAHAFSSSAKNAIEKNGGSAVIKE